MRTSSCCVESAKQLALRDRNVGFQLFLNQLLQNSWPRNQAYKPELIRWVREAFPSRLASDASEDLVIAFLRTRSQGTRDR